MLATEIWLNSAPRANLTKSDLQCLSGRASLKAKIGNCNDCGLYQHEFFKCANVLLGPFGEAGSFYRPELAGSDHLFCSCLELLVGSWLSVAECHHFPVPLELGHWSLEHGSGCCQACSVGRRVLGLNRKILGLLLQPLMVQCAVLAVLFWAPLCFYITWHKLLLVRNNVSLSLFPCQLRTGRSSCINNNLKLSLLETLIQILGVGSSRDIHAWVCCVKMRRLHWWIFHFILEFRKIRSLAWIAWFVLGYQFSTFL